jgi:hypothetical protein
MIATFVVPIRISLTPSAQLPASADTPEGETPRDLAGARRALHEGSAGGGEFAGIGERPRPSNAMSFAGTFVGAAKARRDNAQTVVIRFISIVPWNSSRL